MDLKIRQFFLMSCLFIMPVSIYAGDFDGSKPLSGTVGKIMEINPFKVKNDVDPDVVGLQKKFLIDFNEKKNTALKR